MTARENQASVLDNFHLPSAGLPPMAKVTDIAPAFDCHDLVARLPDDPTNSFRGKRGRDKFILSSRDIDAPADAPETRTELWDALPEISGFLDRFPGRIYRAQISCVRPGGIVRAHRDGLAPDDTPKPGLPLFASTLRLHIPLITSSDNYMYSDGQFYQMKAGELWHLDNLKPHGVINVSADLARYHLIFDVRPTAGLLEQVRQGDSRATVAAPDGADRITSRPARP